MIRALIDRLLGKKPARPVWTIADERALREARRLHRPTRDLTTRKQAALHAKLVSRASGWRGAR